MESVETNDTLPDDAWKDSFDKLLDQRPILRELNVIKRDVRASFNMNSSYENSNDKCSFLSLDYEDPPRNLSSAEFPQSYLQVHNNVKGKVSSKHIDSNIISTPISNHLKENPFKCILSPIGPWELRNFRSDNRRKSIRFSSKAEFNATPIINKAIINVEYNDGTTAATTGIPEMLPRYSVGSSPLALVRKKWKTKNQKQIYFAFKEPCVEDKNNEGSKRATLTVTSNLVSNKFNLPPGKWRKSLNYLRLKHCHEQNEAKRISLKTYCQKGRSTGGIENPKSSIITSVAGQRKSIYIKLNSFQTRTGSRSTYSLRCNDFKRQILQRCGQRRVLSFEGIYSEEYLRNCLKIGEGAFGEVFVHTNPQRHQCDNDNIEKTVLKVIPIEGKELVNGEVQKTFEQILPEVIISMELCGLNNGKRKKNVTSGFVNLKRVRCVKGQYPAHLQKLWKEYDLENESENDHPKCFTSNQQYIILELAFSGKDLEIFQFKNAEQSFFALQQIILTLAVGENAYQFEHRDLHWGNVLVLNTNQKHIFYKIGEKIVTIPSKGVHITIIDYTLSRMTFNDYCFYNDLSTDEELFIATGDYQFEIYRMMRNVLNNKWETFEPKTNIFWISYIISKLIDGVSYKYNRSKNHLHYIEKLKQLQTTILTYKSCSDLAEDI